MKPPNLFLLRNVKVFWGPGCSRNVHRLLHHQKLFDILSFVVFFLQWTLDKKKGELPFPLHLPSSWYSVIVSYSLQLFKGFPTEIPPPHKVRNFHIGYLIKGGNSVCLKEVVQSNWNINVTYIDWWYVFIFNLHLLVKILINNPYWFKVLFRGNKFWSLGHSIGCSVTRPRCSKLTIQI